MIKDCLSWRSSPFSEWHKIFLEGHKIWIKKILWRNKQHTILYEQMNDKRIRIGNIVLLGYSSSSAVHHHLLLKIEMILITLHQCHRQSHLINPLGFLGDNTSMTPKKTWSWILTVQMLGNPFVSWIVRNCNSEIIKSLLSDGGGNMRKLLKVRAV
jgi:hypothetical protein